MTFVILNHEPLEKEKTTEFHGAKTRRARRD